MDRSFLSDEEVIEASRDFVCIRTATYEDKREATFLMYTLFGGADDLRNFGFCILAPDGKRKLKDSNRGPNFVYETAIEMGEDLRRIARQFPELTTENEAHLSLPQMKSARLGLNVASCDGLPCIVVLGTNQDGIDQLIHNLNEVIWDEELMGKFIFASTENRADLNVVPGASSKTGILVIAPNEYGTKGQLIEAIGADVTHDDLKRVLFDAAANFTRKSKNHGSHVRYGRRNGETWQTEVPVPSRRRANNRR